MPLVMIYDTETTGLPLWSLPSEHPDQPHICEISAVLADTVTRQVVDELDTLIKPDGWTIPPEMTAIHGITTEQAAELGIPEDEAVLRLVEMARRAGFGRAGHNESFDARIVRIALKRFGLEAQADEWAEGQAHCTMRLATPVCNVPPTEAQAANGRKAPKAPDLGEAFRHFTGRTRDAAHEGLEDTRAAMVVLFGVLDHYGGNLPAAKAKAAPKARTQAPRAARVAAAAVTFAADDDGVSFLSR